MKRIGLVVLSALFLLILLLTGCAPEQQPEAESAGPVNMETVCKYDGEVVELEGKLLLPQTVSCTTEEPLACILDLYDPFREISVQLEVPVSNSEDDVPVNYMAPLPDNFILWDFFINSGGGQLIRDHNLVSIQAEVDTDYGAGSCKLVDAISVRKLEYLAYAGVDLTRVTLQEALSDGIVVASITGDGLTRIDLTLKPQVEFNLEVEIEPGTMFLSGTEGVQNMVVRRQEFVYLKPGVEVSVEVEVSCANMELKQPESSDVFTVGSDPPDEDLIKLLAYENLLLYEEAVQQFAIWTITDNPYNYISYVGINQDEYTEYPSPSQLKTIFNAAGIDTSKYSVFQN